MLSELQQRRQADADRTMREHQALIQHQLEEQRQQQQQQLIQQQQQ